LAFRLVQGKKLLGDRRSAAMVEMAMVGPVVLLFLMVIFEVAYDQFLQGALQSTVELTAHQMQVGSTQNTATAAAFLSNDFCPNTTGGLLNCNNVYIRVEAFDTTACTDFYDATSPALPVEGHALQLGDYAGLTAAVGDPVGPTHCDASTPGTGFCNPGPSEEIILTAIYLAPTFLMGLLPGNAVTYNGSAVRALMTTSGFETESFAAAATPVGPQC
jgi:hypothetical protein